MKKKFLSLVLALAIALSLLPTTALAAGPHDESCSGTLDWSGSDAEGHVASCTGGTEGCTGIAKAPHDAWDDWAVDAEDAAKHARTCATCGFKATEDHAPASTPVYVKVDETNHAPKCAACDTTISASAAPHDYTGVTPESAGTENHTYTCKADGCDATKTEAHSYVGGTCACGAKESAGPVDPPAAPKAITAFTVVPTPGGSVTVGGSINFALDTASTSEGASDAAKAALTLDTATWKKDGAALSPQPAAGKAPAEAGSYTVEFTAQTTSESFTIAASVKATVNVTVTAAAEPEPEPPAGTITVNSAVFNDAGTELTVTFTPANVAGPFEAVLRTAQGADIKTAQSASSPITITGLTRPSSSASYIVEVMALPGGSIRGRMSVSYDPAAHPLPGDKTPTTNSQGIPVASEVSTEKQANAAIDILKSAGASSMASRLASSSDAVSSFRALESRVMAVKNIRVTVDVDWSEVPSVMRSGVDIDGAAFNAVGSNTTVSLVVEAPSHAFPYAVGYQVDMRLTGVSDTRDLAVPVLVTLPVPADVRPERAVVLHYHDGSSIPTVITPSVSGDYITFPLTGFSTIGVTDASLPLAGSGYYGGYISGSVRRDNSNMDAVMVAIAAMLSGDGVYVDVPASHWASKEIRWARNGGLMSGYEDGSFRPWSATTRQQLWMVLGRLSGARPGDMEMARQWAVNTGVSDGSNPHSALSRQQFVTMLYRFAKSQGVNVSASSALNYKDAASVAPYAREAMAWAAARGIVGGDSAGRLNPEGTATRAHFAVFLYRYSQK